MDFIKNKNKKNGSLNNPEQNGISLGVKDASQKLLGNNLLEEKLKASEAFNFISKPPRNYSNLLDKIKVISNLLINKKVFDFLIQYPLRGNRIQKNIKIGSEVLNNLRYTAIITKYDDIENYSILATIRGFDQSRHNLPGSITSFLLRKDKTLINLWQNRVEVRVIGNRGIEHKMVYTYTSSD